jgi:hypothetical protein
MTKRQFDLTAIFMMFGGVLLLTSITEAAPRLGLTYWAVGGFSAAVSIAGCLLMLWRAKKWPS